MKKSDKPTKPDNCGASAEQHEDSMALSAYAGALGFEDEVLSGDEHEADPRAIVLQPGIQALWNAVLPMIGARRSRPGEYPGLFKVESGPGEGEATIYLDIPAEPYRAGEPAAMDRVLALRVKLDHDYRMLGGRYYCIDCEVPSGETRH